MLIVWKYYSSLYAPITCSVDDRLRGRIYQTLDRQIIGNGEDSKDVKDNKVGDGCGVWGDLADLGSQYKYSRWSVSVMSKSSLTSRGWRQSLYFEISCHFETGCDQYAICVWWCPSILAWYVANMSPTSRWFFCRVAYFGWYPPKLTTSDRFQHWNLTKSCRDTS